MEILHAVNPFFALSGFLVGALVGWGLAAVR